MTQNLEEVLDRLRIEADGLMEQEYDDPEEEIPVWLAKSEGIDYAVNEIEEYLEEDVLSWESNLIHMLCDAKYIQGYVSVGDDKHLQKWIDKLIDRIEAEIEKEIVNYE